MSTDQLESRLKDKTVLNPETVENRPESFADKARELKDNIRDRTNTLLKTLGFKTQNQENKKDSNVIINTEIVFNDYLDPLTQEDKLNYYRESELDKALKIKEKHFNENQKIDTLSKSARTIFEQMRSPVNRKTLSRETFYSQFINIFYKLSLNHIDLTNETSFASMSSEALESLQALFALEQKKQLNQEQKSIHKDDIKMNIITTRNRQKPEEQVFSLEPLTPNYFDRDSKNKAYSVFNGINSIGPKILEYDFAIRDYYTNNLSIENLIAWEKHRQSIGQVHATLEHFYNAALNSRQGQWIETSKDNEMIVTQAKLSTWHGEKQIEEDSNTKDYFRKKYGEESLKWVKNIKDFQIRTVNNMTSRDNYGNKELTFEQNKDIMRYAQEFIETAHDTDPAQLIKYLYDFYLKVIPEYEQKEGRSRNINEFSKSNIDIYFDEEKLLKGFDPEFIMQLASAIKEIDIKKYPYKYQPELVISQIEDKKQFYKVIDDFMSPAEKGARPPIVLENKTGLIEEEIEQLNSSNFLPKDKFSPNGYIIIDEVKRRIISSKTFDLRNGGVQIDVDFLRKGKIDPLSAVIILPEQNDDDFNRFYNQFKIYITDYLSTADVAAKLAFVHDQVIHNMPYDIKARDIVNKSRNDPNQEFTSVHLEEYLNEGAGVCREQGLLAACLIDRLIQDKILPSGKVLYNHNIYIDEAYLSEDSATNNFFHGSHLWARYEIDDPESSLNKEVYIIDPAQHKIETLKILQKLFREEKNRNQLSQKNQRTNFSIWPYATRYDNPI